MTDQLRTAAQQALEALEWHLARGAYGADLEGVTGNLRDALAESQEPDPWGAGYEAGYAAGVAEYDPQQAQQALEEADRIMVHDDEATEWRERWGHLFGGPPPRPAEPVQEPLSDEELDRLWREPMSADWEHREFARAIEAAHGIGGEA
jgi:hypothetical protein